MGFAICYIITAILLSGAYITNAPVTFALILAFVIVPLLDYIIGPQKHFVPTNGRIAKAMLFLWTPLQLAMLLLGFVFVANISLLAALGWSVPIGLLTGTFGITIGHELGHKYNVLSRASAKLLFVSVCFPSFPIEHNLGHHVNVATKIDPATSRYGESLWAFLLRTIPTQFLDAWKIEARRITKSKIGKPYGIKNEMLWLTIGSLALIIVSFLIGGLPALVFFISQSAIAIFLLQAVNYIEHYGLERKQDAGSYEKVGSEHSWDSNWFLSNHMLFGLQQHADHHQHAQKDFQNLKPEMTAPNMKFGYPTMVVLALVPSLWRSVVHKESKPINEFK